MDYMCAKCGITLNKVGNVIQGIFWGAEKSFHLCHPCHNAFIDYYDSMIDRLMESWIEDSNQPERSKREDYGKL